MTDDQEFLSSLALLELPEVMLEERYRGRDWSDMSHFLGHFTESANSLFGLLDDMAIQPGASESGFARQRRLGARAVSLYGPLPLADPTWAWATLQHVIRNSAPVAPSRGWNPIRAGQASLWHDGSLWQPLAFEPDGSITRLG